MKSARPNYSAVRVAKCQLIIKLNRSELNRENSLRKSSCDKSASRLSQVLWKLHNFTNINCISLFLIFTVFYLEICLLYILNTLESFIVHICDLAAPAHANDFANFVAFCWQSLNSIFGFWLSAAELFRKFYLLFWFFLANHKRDYQKWRQQLYNAAPA